MCNCFEYLIDPAVRHQHYFISMSQHIVHQFSGRGQLRPYVVSCDRSRKLTASWCLLSISSHDGLNLKLLQLYDRDIFTYFKLTF